MVIHQIFASDNLILQNLHVVIRIRRRGHASSFDGTWLSSEEGEYHRDFSKKGIRKSLQTATYVTWR